MKQVKFITRYASPLGELTLASNGRELTGLWLPNHKGFPAAAVERAQDGGQVAVLQQAAKWLDAYFAGRDPGQVPAIHLEDSLSNLAVWDALTTIACGTTMSYGQLAQLVSDNTGLDTNPRAVGGAVGRNPIAIIIPCHRVVGSDGSLTGYAGGLDAKQWLLQHEQATK